MTIGEILAAVPRSARREAERVIQKSSSSVAGMLTAAKALRAVLQPHAEILARMGLDASYAAYAMIYFRHFPNGDMYEFIARAESEAKALEQRANKLQRQNDVLQRLLEPPPPN